MAGNKRKRKGTTDKNNDDVDDDGRRGLILLSKEEIERLPQPSKEARDNALEGTDIKVLNRLFKSRKVQRDRVLELREERRKIKNRINQRRHRQRELDEIAELEAEADDLGMHLKECGEVANICAEEEALLRRKLELLTEEREEILAELDGIRRHNRG